MRLTEELPQTGVYFDRSELNEGPHERPIPAAYLTKFDSVDGVSRVFDSGNIRVYDLRGLLDAN